MSQNTREFIVKYFQKTMSGYASLWAKHAPATWAPQVSILVSHSSSNMLLHFHFSSAAYSVIFFLFTHLYLESLILDSEL